MDATEGIIEVSLPSLQKKRRRPLRLKFYQRPAPSTNRVLRDRTNKLVCIVAMKVSLNQVLYEDIVSKDNLSFWKQAIDNKMSSLLKNQTWEFEALSKG